MSYQINLIESILEHRQRNRLETNIVESLIKIIGSFIYILELMGILNFLRKLLLSNSKYQYIWKA